MGLCVFLYQITFVLVLFAYCSCISPPFHTKSDIKCDSGKAYDQLSNSCCRECGPGYGVALPCVEKNDTVCQPCVNGENWSASTSYEDFCETCKLCPSNAKVLHKCNSTHNTKCECDDGYYYYVEQKMCKLCDRCSPGYQAQPTCSPWQNTVCKPCPLNHYSNVTSSKSVCKVCSLCTNSKRVKTECSPTQDTVCENINGDNNDNDEIMINESGQNLIPLYCVPFGLIVLLLIGYVIIKRWRLCCTAPSKSLPSTSSMKPILDHGSLTNRSARQEIKPMLGGVINESMPVINLHNDVMTTLEQLLTECDVDVIGWKSLAHCSGFTESQINRLDLEATKCKLPAAKLFFRDWNRSSPSVNQLCDNLTKIRRDDCVQIIRHMINYKNCESSPVQFI